MGKLFDQKLAEEEVLDSPGNQGPGGCATKAGSCALEELRKVREGRRERTGNVRMQLQEGRNAPEVWSWT